MTERFSKRRFGVAQGAFVRWLAATFLLLIPALVGLRAEPMPSKEYQIKAAFLFNFAQFVDWPADTFTNADQPFCIGILGNDPFGKALEQTVQGESIHGRRLTIKRAQSLEELKECQLIFISQSEKGRLAQILRRSADHKVLTVSEIQGFAHRGGMINFILEGSKVRFEINPGAAQREGLRISSQLLSLGKVVQTEPGKEND